MVLIRANPINSTVPLGISGLTVAFWMTNPSVAMTATFNYKMTYPNCKLYIQLQRPYNETSIMNASERKMLSYEINHYNLYNVKEVFKEALEWFDYTNERELFGVSDDGKVMLNSSYSDLSSSYIDKSSGVQTAIKIVPSVVNPWGDEYEAGVVIYFNRQSNFISLTKNKFKKLARYIIDFNLDNMALYTLTSMMYAEKVGSILSPEEAEKAYIARRQYTQ